MKSLKTLKAIMTVCFMIGLAFAAYSGVDALGVGILVANAAAITLSPESLKSIQEMIDAKNKEMSDKLEKSASMEEIEKIKSEIDKFIGFQDVIKKQGEELELLKKEGAGQSKAKTLNEQIAESLKAKQSDLSEALKEKRAGFHEVMEVKVAGTITFANVTDREMLASQLLPGYINIQRRSPFLLSIVQRGTTSSKTIHWIEKQNSDGTVVPIAEGGAKTLIDFDWVEKKLDMEKIPAKIKVSTEMLNDIPFMSSAINDELMEQIDLAVDAQILSGSGVSPNMNGITTNAAAFAAGALANTVDQANNFDVIRAAVAQIALANFSPNYVLVNPVDAASMDLTKASDGHYVMPPFTTTDGQVIAGVRVIENTGIAADDFVVGDFSRAKFWMRENVNIMIGWENDDFTKNLVTIIGETRGNLIIPANHTDAFVYGDFTTAKAALETP